MRRPTHFRDTPEYRQPTPKAPVFFPGDPAKIDPNVQRIWALTHKVEQLKRQLTTYRFVLAIGMLALMAKELSK